ncbi:unnamed protein product [Jaminaea pallidilutea]
MPAASLDLPQSRSIGHGCIIQSRHQRKRSSRQSTAIIHTAAPDAKALHHVSSFTAHSTPRCTHVHHFFTALLLPLPLACPGSLRAFFAGLSASSSSDQSMPFSSSSSSASNSSHAGSATSPRRRRRADSCCWRHSSRRSADRS